MKNILSLRSVLSSPPCKQKRELGCVESRLRTLGLKAPSISKSRRMQSRERSFLGDLIVLVTFTRVTSRDRRLVNYPWIRFRETYWTRTPEKGDFRESLLVYTLNVYSKLFSIEHFQGGRDHNVTSSLAVKPSCCHCQQHCQQQYKASTAKSPFSPETEKLDVRLVENRKSHAFCDGYLISTAPFTLVPHYLLDHLGFDDIYTSFPGHPSPLLPSGALKQSNRGASRRCFPSA